MIPRGIHGNHFHHFMILNVSEITGTCNDQILVINKVMSNSTGNIGNAIWQLNVGVPVTGYRIIICTYIHFYTATTIFYNNSQCQHRLIVGGRDVVAEHKKQLWNTSALGGKPLSTDYESTQAGH